jgi:hypothetical protein
VEAVGVPGEDGVRVAVAEVLEELLVSGPGFAAVGGEVVVGVDGDDLDAELRGEGFAVLALAFDAEAGAFAVAADAAVDDGAGRDAGCVDGHALAWHTKTASAGFC